MKKIVLFALLLCMGSSLALAQRVPVKHHSWAFMGLEGGVSNNWYTLSEPYKLSGFGFGGYYVGLHIEFLAGNRQQHGFFVDEGVEAIKGKIQAPGLYEGTVDSKVTNLYVKAGYKYAFRNAFFVEVFPQLDIPLNPTIIDPTTERREITPSTREKTKLGFSIGASVGRNITDNLAVVFRVKKSFTDYFYSDVYTPYMFPGVTKGSFIFQIGLVLGFNL
ncbi:MAG: outer membrane beta-barrel protein [Bacteroidales bacterium]|nr:outer membrane beta-barrel protein [Bacteroidales bacterium]